MLPSPARGLQVGQASPAAPQMLNQLRIAIPAVAAAVWAGQRLLQHRGHEAPTEVPSAADQVRQAGMRVRQRPPLLPPTPPPLNHPPAPPLLHSPLALPPAAALTACPATAGRGRGGVAGAASAGQGLCAAALPCAAAAQGGAAGCGAARFPGVSGGMQHSRVAGCAMHVLCLGVEADCCFAAVQL